MTRVSTAFTVKSQEPTLCSDFRAGDGHSHLRVVLNVTLHHRASAVVGTGMRRSGAKGYFLSLPNFVNIVEKQHIGN